MTKLISLKDLDFLLYQVFDAEQLTQLDRYKEHDKTTFNSILDTAEGIATDFFAPIMLKLIKMNQRLMGKKSQQFPK